jgi:hypothetical protein
LSVIITSQFALTSLVFFATVAGVGRLAGRSALLNDGFPFSALAAKFKKFVVLLVKHEVMLPIAKPMAVSLWLSLRQPPSFSNDGFQIGFSTNRSLV